MSRGLFASLLACDDDASLQAIAAYPTLRHARASNGATPLLVAAGVGSLRVVEALLAAGATLGEVDEAGATAVHVAAGAGRDDVLQSLTSSADFHRRGAAAVLEARTAEGETPLMHAARSGFHLAISTLVRLGADVHAVSDVTGLDALALAALSGWAPAVQELLAAGASPSRATREGVLPVMFACQGGSVPTVKALLEAGVGGGFYAERSPAGRKGRDRKSVV